jgi:hypothetical protein
LLDEAMASTRSFLFTDPLPYSVSDRRRVNGRGV